MPPFPVGCVVRIFLAGGGGDQGRVLSRSMIRIWKVKFCGKGWASTRSKAAIFLLLTWSFAGAFSGTYLATRRVAGESAPGLLSVQVVRSFGFWDVGVKKLATALSVCVRIMCQRMRSMHDERITGNWTNLKWQFGLFASRAEAKWSGRLPPRDVLLVPYPFDSWRLIVPEDAMLVDETK